MQTLLLLCVIFCFSLPPSSRAEESCKSRQQALEFKLKQYNKAFGKNIQIEWHSKRQWAAKGQPPTIFGAHVDPETSRRLALMNFCEDSNPPPDSVTDYILAHEFTHTLIDSDKNLTQCLRAMATELGEPDFSHYSAMSENMREHHKVHHFHNIELMTFKLLNAEGVDTKKMIRELLNYARTVPNHGKRIQSIYRTRFSKLPLTTSFADGNDYYPGFFAGENNYKQYLEKKFPQSTMLADIKSKLGKQKRNCLYSSKKDLQKALVDYNKTTTKDATSPDSSQR